MVLLTCLLSLSHTPNQITPDGHCLFSAVADQLAILNVVPPQTAYHVLTRKAAAEYMLAHPQDFVPFLPSVEGEDGAGAGDAGTIGPQEYARYCANIRDTAVWGGEPEILALSRAYTVPIHVVQGGQPPVVVHNPNGAPTTDNLKEQRAVWISYHRRMYGLGEVRPLIYSRAHFVEVLYVLIHLISTTTRSDQGRASKGSPALSEIS